MSEYYNPEQPKGGTINLAIGPSCPVRCEGCYNYFGSGPIVDADAVLDFAVAAKQVGVTQATLSGGDPLFHPEIVPIAKGLKDADLSVKMDTVGTALLPEPQESPGHRILYQGRGFTRGVAIEDIAAVDFVNLPLDGASQEMVGDFRKGRPGLYAETLAVAGLLRASKMPFGFNTVLHAKNIERLRCIQRVARQQGAREWQVFEYDPTGPNPTRRHAELQLTPGQFEEETQKLPDMDGAMEITSKSLRQRSGAYFLVNRAGVAWSPSEAGPSEIGHITDDRDLVLAALVRHIEASREEGLGLGVAGTNLRAAG
ncbi:hypothetical protein CR970_01545 [Candidatus Saccharibacteria bacterium]|nr:MAG: hypothetical protein CR970_01545 [Candidatus Saccharibacteria bacterium]